MCKTPLDDLADCCFADNFFLMVSMVLVLRGDDAILGNGYGI